MMTPYGVREICDVVLKAKTNMMVGNRKFYKNEPVLYFDTLKTSTLEGAATTVYATGGRGNSRLIAWEGERTITFTMEDALISPTGFMILSGADLIDGSEKAIYQHIAEEIGDGDYVEGTGANTVLYVKESPYQQKENEKDVPSIYVMVLDDNGSASSEPFLFKPKMTEDETPAVVEKKINGDTYYAIELWTTDYTADVSEETGLTGTHFLVDYYTERTAGAQQINITPDKFGGNFYLEASTLFKNEAGVDEPAEFIIPNCKVQSNFTFTMASSGDPSTFTFTMDAFPDYTRFDKSKKVLAALQIIKSHVTGKEETRQATAWDYKE